LKLAIQYKDSLYNQERDGQILEMRALYDLERQDKTIQLLEKENAIEKHKASNQQLLMILFIVVILLLSILLYIFWRLRQTQAKTNRELAEKNQNIALQNEEIQSQAESLHEINQLKSKILSVISHDLRGPVNNLHALLELVTRERLTAEEFVQMSFKLKSNLNVTQRALENLLNWSLGQMEGIKTEPVVFNINSIVEDVAFLSEEQANRKQIIVKTDNKEPMFVEADVNQVHLILRNLFNNAIKFSKRDGEVTMLAEKKGKFCYIHIEDNGIGMTKAEVEMILNSMSISQNPEQIKRREQALGFCCVKIL
jgi:Signal transduction histidine kinase